jgi:hypothetical protein
MADSVRPLDNKRGKNMEARERFCAIAPHHCLEFTGTECRVMTILHQELSHTPIWTGSLNSLARLAGCRHRSARNAMTVALRAGLIIRVFDDTKEIHIGSANWNVWRRSKPKDQTMVGEELDSLDTNDLVRQIAPETYLSWSDQRARFLREVEKRSSRVRTIIQRANTIAIAMDAWEATNPCPLTDEEISAL